MIFTEILHEMGVQMYLHCIMMFNLVPNVHLFLGSYQMSLVFAHGCQFSQGYYGRDQLQPVVHSCYKLMDLNKPALIKIFSAFSIVLLSGFASLYYSFLRGHTQQW